jgi:hypothetical protein
MSDSIDSPPLPLAEIVPSYAYQQYADDPNIVAFFTAFNELAQSYLDWFNYTPLAVYTNPTISAELLGWVATGIYGIERPVFSSETTKYVAGLNTLPRNTISTNGERFFRSGTATIADDDYYRRTLTWWLYVGNGRMFCTTLLRLKVARFLFGVNGTDITLDQVQSIHIQPTLIPTPSSEFVVTIDGVVVEPTAGTSVIPSDPESYFFVSPTGVTSVQG